MSNEAIEQALEAYCKTLHPLWNARISRTQADGFFRAGFQAAEALAKEPVPISFYDEQGNLKAHFNADEPVNLQYMQSQPAPVQEPVIGTKTWFDPASGKVFTQDLHPSDVYAAQPEQEQEDTVAIPKEQFDLMLAKANVELIQKVDKLLAKLEEQGA